MRPSRRRGLSVLVATVLLGAATVTLASVPPRPLRSVLTVTHALSLRVATDWLAVVALLSLGERVAASDKTVTRRTVGRLAVAVFVGGFAIEVSPTLRLVGSSTLSAGALLGGVSTAVQGSLFATGLFVATAAGGATLRDTLGGGNTGGLPLAPTDRWLPQVTPAAVVRVAQVLGVVAVCWFGIEVAARLAAGPPYFWLAVAESAVAALGGVVDYGVLAVAFLALAVDGVNVRSVVGGSAAVWTGLVALSIAVAVLSAALGVALVGATVTPMAAVEGAGMGLWPAPDSWTQLLATGTFLAGAAGLLTIQRTTRDPETRDANAAVDDSPTR